MSLPPLPITGPLPAGMKGFAAGLKAFTLGLKLVLPGGGLFRYAIGPAVVAAVVFAGVAVLAFVGTTIWLLSWLQESWLGWLGGLLAFLLALLLAYVLFIPVMSLFAPWFVDPICNRVYQRYTGWELYPPRTSATLMARQLAAFGQFFWWLVMALFVQLPLAVLSLFTGVMVVIAVPVNTIIDGIGLMEYPLSLRGGPKAGKLKWVRRNFWPAAGMGTGASLLMLVPFLNLFVLSAGAAAATVLMLATDSSGTESAEHS